jgi:cobalt/nickel transport system permease protein
MTTTAPDAQKTRSKTVWFVVGGILVALLLAGIVSYYASSSPDGLERVAADQGLDANVQDSAVADSPLADYGVAGVESERLGVGLAGVIGVAVTFAVAGGLFLLVRKRGDTES